MSDHYFYKGHCKKCGRRHSYDGPAFFRSGTTDLMLQNPIECMGCHDVLFIYNHDHFYGEETAQELYASETREVPRIHQNGKIKKAAYWFHREWLEAKSRHAEDRNRRYHENAERDQKDAQRRQEEVQDLIRHGKLENRSYNTFSDLLVNTGFKVLLIGAVGLVAVAAFGPIGLLGAALFGLLVKWSVD
jgi:hypothetical protein